MCIIILSKTLVSNKEQQLPAKLETTTTHHFIKIKDFTLSPGAVDVGENHPY